MRTLAFCMLLALAGCSGNATPRDYNHAVELCASHAGLENFATDHQPDLTFMSVLCSDGSQVQHTYQEVNR